MGRSNTLPISEPSGYDSKRNKNEVAPKRSQTVQFPKKSKHQLPHLPFHHTHSSPSSTNGSHTTARPAVPDRQNSVQTRYMNMLLDLDTIPRMHNIYASFFSWILLAGFVIFPATFTSVSARISDDNIANNPQVQALLKLSTSHEWLLYIASFSSGIGAAGMVWLWWRWRANFVWLLNRIFLPGCLNSLAGLISTLVNVYSQQHGIWSTQAWVTLGVTGGSAVITGLLFAIYNFFVLKRVKDVHGKEMIRQRENEGLVEKLGRKAHEPALQPGSVV